MTDVMAGLKWLNSLPAKVVRILNETVSGRVVLLRANTVHG
jgi:hypothetical protein